MSRSGMLLDASNPARSPQGFATRLARGALVIIRITVARRLPDV